MGKISRNGAQAALAEHFTSVQVTVINSISDLQALVARKPDLVFLGMTFLPMNPALGWEDPEKIWISDYLELHEIAYTGSRRTASILERNKNLAKQRVLDSGLSTSPFFVAKQDETLRKRDIELMYPLFVKPANRGGGLGIDSASLVTSFEQLEAKVQSISRELHSDALIEQYLPGREFSVAILRDEHSGDFRTMPLELIAPVDQSGGRFLSAKVKSADSETFVEVTDEGVKSRISTLALDAFEALGARDYGRIDIRLDRDGSPHFLEANLIPSLMNGYGNFPKACLMNGINYQSMLMNIVNLAFSRSPESIVATTDRAASAPLVPVPALAA